MNIIKTDLERIKNYRTAYLNSLPEFQELYIELMIERADPYFLRVESHEVGYTIINSEGVLIEFFVKKEYYPQSREYLNQITEELSVSEIYCKSFDFLLLSNCLLNAYAYSVTGMLYKDYVTPRVSMDNSIVMKLAGRSNVIFLLEQDESIRELFETKAQLVGFIKKEKVFMFYRHEEFVGCGMVLRTNKDWNYCDLGVWTHPGHRNKGIGTQIILRLREFALKNNMKPGCGCAIENIASQKTIEKSGFVSRHRLVDFRTGG